MIKCGCVGHGGARWSEVVLARVRDGELIPWPLWLDSVFCVRFPANVLDGQHPRQSNTREFPRRCDADAGAGEQVVSSFAAA